METLVYRVSRKALWEMAPRSQDNDFSENLTKTFWSKRLSFSGLIFLLRVFNPFWEG